MSYPPPPPPPPSPGSRPKPWGAIAIAVVGSGLLTVAMAISMGVILGLLFWQLLANVVMVAFVQELRWYGPGLWDATDDGDLWQWVLGLGVSGTVLVAIAGSMLARTGTPFPRPRRGRPAGP